MNQKEFLINSITLCYVELSQMPTKGAERAEQLIAVLLDRVASGKCLPDTNNLCVNGISAVTAAKKNVETARLNMLDLYFRELSATLRKKELG